METAWFSLPLAYIATLFTIGLTVRWCYKRRHRSWYSRHAEQDSLAKRAKRTCCSIIPSPEVFVTLLIICVLCAGVMLKFKKTDMSDGIPVGTNDSM